jgi:hypothetical protein
VLRLPPSELMSNLGQNCVGQVQEAIRQELVDETEKIVSWRLVATVCLGAIEGPSAADMEAAAAAPAATTPCMLADARNCALACIKQEGVWKISN